jgi:hypothetical protein
MPHPRGKRGIIAVNKAGAGWLEQSAVNGSVPLLLQEVSSITSKNQGKISHEL